MNIVPTHSFDASRHQAYEFNHDMVNQHNQQQMNQIVSNAQMNTVPLSIDVVGQPFANSNQLLVTGLPHIQNVNSIGSLPYMDQSQARQLIPMMSEVERPKRTRTHVCNYENCNKSFDTKWGLARHIRSHTGEKPYVCNFPGCGKGFTEKCALKRHELSHSTEKPYKCTYAGCEKAFKCRDYLEYHLRLHEEPHPYRCTYEDCGREFMSPKSLKKHQRLWHNIDGKDGNTESLLRNRITKMQSKYKEKLEKIDRQLKTTLESNKMLKRQNQEMKRKLASLTGHPVVNNESNKRKSEEKMTLLEMTPIESSLNDSILLPSSCINLIAAHLSHITPAPLLMACRVDGEQTT